MEANCYEINGSQKGKIYFDFLPCINYSMQHNHLEALIECKIINESDSTWQDIDFEISGKMFITSNTHIDMVPQGEEVQVEGLSIKANPSSLIELTEGIDEYFELKILRDSQIIFKKNFEINLMAYDQWSGLSIRPELLASFVTPNHPLLTEISNSASKFLEKWTESGSLDEYQSQDPNRVRLQIAAIYEALRSKSLIYATPPASFEKFGQRIRTVDKVLSEKLGTCIDLSVLFASCLEHIGINPILILTQGHCFVGAWLVNDSFYKPVSDDGSFLLKGASDGINEIVVLETTLITSSSAKSFDEAVSMGLKNLHNEDQFNYFIDIFSARINGIRPLPLRIYNDGWLLQNEGLSHENATKKVKQYDRYDLSNYDKSDTEVTRMTIWERKLLDFTLRNNLLNMKFGKKIIPLVSFSINKMEDYMQDGKSFKIYPFPILEAAQKDTNGAYSSRDYEQLEEHVIQGFDKKILYSFKGDNDLKNALKYIYRTSRTSMEENGANNLFLVLGVLKWFESEKSQQPRLAPILLLPIEIVRASGASGYIVRTRDEEIVLNTTLVELLKQQHEVNLSSLEELPRDEYGVDVKMILSVVRNKILTKKGWDVLDESMIGIFSFNKFVMWNDIHTNADKILQNDIIASLVEGKLKLPSNLDETDARKIDKEHRPEDYILPVDVDSSQLEAVIDSGLGKSFILYGPPGTGKSQTITNMIANALYQGKRVLFVAEKMAALSVVQSRLEKIGLAPFCLELHSNKANKSHFLKQMDEAINISHPKSPEEYKLISDELFEKRKALIDYVEALHTKHEFGLSLYDCITAYLSYPEDEIEIDLDQIAEISQIKIAEYEESIKRLDTIFRISGNPSKSPIKFMDIKDGSTKAEQLLFSYIKECLNLLSTWTKDKNTFSNYWGFEVIENEKGINWLNQLLNLLSDLPYFSEKLCCLPLDGKMLQDITNAIEAGNQNEIKTKELVSTYSEKIIDLDIDQLETEWNEINSKWFLPKLFAKKAFFKKMSKYKEGFDENDLHDLVTKSRDCLKYREIYKSQYDTVSDLFGSLAYYEKEEWSTMKEVIDKLPLILDLTVQMGELYNLTNQEAAKTIGQAIKGNWNSFTKQHLDTFVQLANKGKKILDSLKQMTTIATFNIEDTDWSNSLPKCLESILKNQDNFVNWYAWCKQKHLLEENGLSDVVEYILEHDISGEKASMAFSKGLYHKLALKIINTTEGLRFFNGLLFEETIQKYRQLAKDFQEISKQELFCKLAANVPSITMAAHDSSEVGILKRNIRNRGRGMSIRKIIDKVPNLLPKLCPCMLMSPISVAQYIDLDNEKFDLVIFDEASQIPTSQSVGAIARGKSLVVVGDPKQMPPTSFFSASQVDEEEAHMDDLESILDDCIALSMPSKYLSWHYRSKHESLIAFSNTQYYDGRLITFPSVDDQVTKVTLRKIDGVYDKGKTRSNKAEAEAIVEEVKRRLSDPTLSKYSIGVVSFSKVQQNLIEDILCDELAKDANLEKLAYECEEPIFVKNLENVQGDERDVILFSIGYGPDKYGKVSMNFGPLNNEGGERRLNVAVSRSRYEMVVFSTLRSEQIDLKKTNALGVEGLKKFLEFAEKGSVPIPSNIVKKSTLSGISQEIAKALESQGYKVNINIGLSKFKIDIAVINPDDPTKYILGILCDGNNYFETKTVRDREVVQPSVLKMLQWNLMHIWSLDWFMRRDEVLNSITKRIDDIKNNRLPQQDNIIKSNIPKLNTSSIKKEEIATNEEEELVSPLCKKYVFADSDNRYYCEDIDLLYDYYHEELKKDLLNIITLEQPITNGLLYKRVVKNWGMSRVSNRLQELVDNLLVELEIHKTSNGKNGFVCWKDKISSEEYEEYRIDSERDIQEIPYTEIANAMKDVLRQQIAMDKEDLKRVTAQQLGFARKGNNIDQATEFALSKLIEKGFSTLQEDKVSISN
ncbi:DUF4011 domain-containing protein [Falsiporphyromonas endometrii]|uniref:DUF4011 domain-containing protein n=1 Tax=Falsiporphyromonas endometrii TaxID=1387297 RepID=A0ABV9K7K3_9PORP